MFRLGVVFIACGVLLGCTAAQTDSGVRTALDALATVVEPAYAFAVDACVARQSLIAAAAERREITARQADEEMEPVRQKCQLMRRTFDGIRVRHEEARVFVEDGKLEQARARLDAIKTEWASIAGGVP